MGVVKLQIRLEGLQNSDRIVVRVNAKAFEATPEKPRWIAADVPASAIAPGRNTLVVSFEDGCRVDCPLRNLMGLIHVEVPSSIRFSRN